MKWFSSSKLQTHLRSAIEKFREESTLIKSDIEDARREVYALLVQGEEATAREKVYVAAKRQQLVDAYETLGIFCELLLRSIAEVESSRHCPPQLRQAAATLVWASCHTERNGNALPPLKEIRKQLRKTEVLLLLLFRSENSWQISMDLTSSEQLKKTKMTASLS
eukprot:CAMPEP_0206406982 /NCGR_PEP_ID=MMETSP0294-20121207/30172_1 /ASSEMBLY_ACC=CAM_ASM_000327 /TAXON_ID=39354 /ORGANISM="Heterosigma akashiwo, Strain CCMP2393" /LENGTH=164 /DNA_ID=CAMNT_0053865943 /DNA_START=1 /DNA_END=492 /DNA_ORIENTATION=+